MDRAILIILFLFWLFSSCNLLSKVESHSLPAPSDSSLTGSDFYQKIKFLDAETRELFIENEIVKGNFPDFMRKFVPINTTITTSNGKTISACYFVMPDYLMIGTNNDFFRIPMQPKTAQKIADSFGCFLSTSKICDDIYKAAIVKLEPLPLTQNRDSISTFYLHNQMIERQRKGRKGLIAGIKKDVILSSTISNDKRPNRVAIYGWHKLDGKPIQPVYTGHVDWYVDYSHGVRLIDRTIYVEGKPMDYIDVLKDPDLRYIISNEGNDLDFYVYPYEK
ncbi:MAG: hypothetical protein Q4G63_06720 [Bacteroidia bacterium]|nr:hypothetical protein [Bacteroidia bacterium]